MSNLIESLNWRYACKKFDSEKKLSEQDVNTLLETMRLTASSYGMQPWSFVRVTNPELRAKILEHSWNQKQVVDASDLFILCAKTNIDEAMVDAYIDDIVKTRKVAKETLEGFKKMMMYTIAWDDARKATWAEKQIYIAMGTLLTACATLKIDSCPMEGFVPAKVDEVLGLRDMGLRSVLMCPVGYRAADDNYADLEKVRFESSEVIKTLS